MSIPRLGNAYTKKNPRQLPAGDSPGGLYQVVRSEVALNANVERNSVLALEGVGSDRLRGNRAERGRSLEAGVGVGPDGFRRERQVLDGGPTGHKAQLRERVVRVAGVGHVLAGNGRGNVCAVV